MNVARPKSEADVASRLRRGSSQEPSNPQGKAKRRFSRLITPLNPTHSPSVRQQTVSQRYLAIPGDAESVSSQTSSVSTASLRYGILAERNYEYKELRAEEFRVLTILPQSRGAIECQIRHEQLPDPVAYCAISYAWGDPDDKTSIRIGTVDVPVTVSLHDALFALRREDRPVTVWVDALCIDQSNRKERSQQVRLMTEIYARARSVAIWLGPHYDDSELAMELLKEIATRSEDRQRIRDLISSPAHAREFGAVISLFQRSYWSRLWVVQEVYNAKEAWVHCGSSVLPWVTYRAATRVFERHKRDIEHYHPGNSRNAKRLLPSGNSFTHAQILVYEGPASIPNAGSFDGLDLGALHTVLRSFRRKLTSMARDRVFGILGVLPKQVRDSFPVNYNQSVKDIYINTVVFLLENTRYLDVICESIHYPKLTNAMQLPTWVPDWSQNPEIAALGYQASLWQYPFSASREEPVRYGIDDRRNQLEISGIYVDEIKDHGVPIGTWCNDRDYLMAFVGWKALMMKSLRLNPTIRSDVRGHAAKMKQSFCRTLCLGQVPENWSNELDAWVSRCYGAFAQELSKEYPELPLDQELQHHGKERSNIRLHDVQQFLYETFGRRMMGRCFCTTQHGLLGMGTGFMLPGDLVIVPLGCRTPVIIRPDGTKANPPRYYFAGDVYIDGYMSGKAIDLWKAGEVKLEKFILI
ncbi:heterokaryon incompatibility protein-domain-containing protein [Xylariomycetidae sp. FL0641]|nr:heterokaryon incompatibility protein-domain-containing protein [Xylariomycetidae sp. FL0641]